MKRGWDDYYIVIIAGLFFPFFFLPRPRPPHPFFQILTDDIINLGSKP